MFRKSLLITTYLILTSCATTAGYRDVVESWRGSNIRELIQSWGPPSSSFRMPNGGMAHTWSGSYGTVFVPVGGNVIGANRTCETTFFVADDGYIYDYRFQGNACKQ